MNFVISDGLANDGTELINNMDFRGQHAGGCERGYYFRATNTWDRPLTCSDAAMDRDDASGITRYEIRLPTFALGVDAFFSGLAISAGFDVNDGDQSAEQEGPPTTSCVP